MADKSMIDALKQYGERSVSGLERMRDALRKQIREAPPELDRVAGTVASFLPGYGLLASGDYAREAGRHWRNGDYGKSMVRMSDAMIPALTETMWAIPGVSAAMKVAK